MMVLSRSKNAASMSSIVEDGSDTNRTSTPDWRRSYPRAWRRQGAWWAPRSSKPVWGRALGWSHRDRVYHTSLSAFSSPGTGQSADRPSEDRTSLQSPSSRKRGGSGNGPTPWKTHGEESHHAGGSPRGLLTHCEARNLSERSLEWYGDRTRRFADWCAA